MNARTWARLPALVAALGVFPLIALVLRRGVDIPFWDEWDWGSLVYAAHTGTLTFAQLWEPHNEHRILVPNLLMLALDRFGGWDPVREELVSLAVLALTQLVLWLLIRRTVPAARRGICFLAASALLLGLAQYENLDWGFQMAWFLCDLGLVFAVWQLARASRSPWPLRLAILAAVLASLSSSQGLLVWPAGLVVVLLIPRGAAVRATAWLASGAVTAAIVRSGTFTSGAPPGHAGPGALLDYVLIYLGSPLAMSWSYPRSREAGIVLVLALLAIAVLGLRAPLARRVRLAPWLAVAAYAVLSGVLTAYGRAAFGPEQANSSRYSSISELAWVAALAGACVLIPRGAARLGLVAGLAAVVIGFSVAQSLAGDEQWRIRAERARVGRAAIAAGDPPALRAVYPQPRRATHLLREMAEVRDGVFYGTPP
jgi:hypothetical protein